MYFSLSLSLSQISYPDLDLYILCEIQESSLVDDLVYHGGERQNVCFIQTFKWSTSEETDISQTLTRTLLSKSIQKPYIQ